MRERLAGVLRWQRLGLVIAVGAFSGWGCQGGYRLTIDNVDAPAVQVILNGSSVGILACEDAPLQLSAGAGLPSLPWKIVLRYDNGREIGPMTVGDSRLTRQTMLIRDVGVILVPPADRMPAAIAPLREGCPPIQAEDLPPEQLSSPGIGEPGGQQPEPV